MNDQCSIAVLESALFGTLPGEDERSLHRHLKECEACTAALQNMAGGPAWCEEAASLLTEDELDAALPARDDWSEADFSVEHLEPADEPNLLGRLGGNDILEVIGRGGMGMVLKGFDGELKRYVAIKVLAPHLAQSAAARKRFIREAQAAAAVVHPHVMAIHQVQPHGRLPFLVMPLVAGESLAERLAAQGPLELKEVLRIGMQAAAGLAAAHEQGLVHRDVKPANIMLERGVERAVLTDFGLARAADDVTLTHYGIIAGTPQYMSPEQAQGETVDGRSDLFSLGCVLYEMASGVSPFRADSMMATLRRLVDEPPQALGALNPELPPWFVAIVERLLQKDPARRFGSAMEVSELLEGCLAHLQQPAHVPLPAGVPVGPLRPARRWLKTRWIGTMMAVLVLASAGVGVFLAFNGDPLGSDRKSPKSNWTFGPTVHRTLICPSRDLQPANALRLEDGRLFDLPTKIDLPAEELDKWYRDSKANLAMSYRKESQEWVLMLRNVKFAELREAPTSSPKDWKTPSADELEQRFAKVEWKKPAGATGKANSKEWFQWFQFLVLTRGMNPPVTFAFETSDGQRGVLQFMASVHEGTGGCKAVIRYKRLQPAE